MNAFVLKDKDIKKVSVFEEFAEMMGTDLSLELLQKLKEKVIYEFLSKRFKVMVASLENLGVASTSVANGNFSKGVNPLVLEFIIKDRPFVVDSMLEYIYAKKYSYSSIFHHVLNISHRTSGEISKIQGGCEDSRDNYAYFCCIFDNIDQSQVKQLRSDVNDLLRLLTMVTDDFSKITGKIDSFAQKKKVKAETLKESEKRRLFAWLNDGNALLLGAGEISGDDVSAQLSWSKIHTPLGFIKFRKEKGNQEFSAKIGRLAKYFLESGLHINFMEIDEISSIHRRDRIQLLFAKNLSDDGEITVSFFAILFTNQSLKENALSIPTARIKINAIIDSYVTGHSRKEAENFFSVLPKSELFRMDRAELKVLFDQSMLPPSRQHVRLFIYDQKERHYARFTFIFHQERFSPQIFERVGEIVNSKLPQKAEISYWYSFNRYVYTHHLIWFDENGPQLNSINSAQLEKAVATLAMSWEDELADLMNRAQNMGVKYCIVQYNSTFSTQYQAMNSPKSAMRDLKFLDLAVRDGRDQVDLRQEANKKHSLIYIYTLNHYNLTKIMPLLHNLSLIVIDENTFEVQMDGQNTFIYSFHVQHEIEHPSFNSYQADFCDLLVSVLEKETEDDPLNGLLSTAGLNRKDINLFIMYRNYYWQIDAPYLPINTGFLENKEVIIALKDYFYEKFDPKNKKKALPANALTALKKRVIYTILNVATVAEDIIFRSIFNLMESTLRTNFFTEDPTTAMAIKVHSKKVNHMPLPKPLYEIYIHGTHMEGIHLRGAMIARGGIRHSDRKNDFRTEILGLMKAQMMKNVVIVPEGSKGGFVTKRTTNTRQELMDEGKKQYQVFMNSLLSLTDNIVKGKVVSSKKIIRYDKKDPYLVVAADKGTAHLSDTANEISIGRGFWLYDAFASGGSNGYDHKKMGITAKGAWESVKLHFLEQGLDIQNTDFSVVGIGDMAGDVFGNGMLLSKHICLKGAFNHLHIFIDPNPDAAVSWTERKRLFELPGSGWNDYNDKLISQGGGIFKRNAKSITLSPEMKQMLRIDSAKLSGEELIKSLLKCDMDLLWNGGIGTYIKSSTETSQQVGDQANDNVRINGNEVKAKVIGEGGNLGLTQLGRIEVARNGGCLNTDAIDNSAGVDTSDHEVNIKILLDSLVQTKKIKTQKTRNKILGTLTAEVAELVLADNISQGQILTMDNLRSRSDAKPFLALIHYLTTRDFLDPDTEFIPKDNQLENYVEDGIGIPKPVLAVLLSYTKMYFYKQIVKSSALDDPYLEGYYTEYFPKSLAKKFDLTKIVHPLRKEIIGTVVVNRAVNQAGVTLLPTIKSIIDCPSVEIISGYTTLDQIFSFQKLRAKIWQEFQVKNINTAYILLGKIESFLQDVLIWLLIRFKPSETQFSMIEELQKPVQEFNAILKKKFSRKGKQCYAGEVEALQELEVPQKLAKEVAWLGCTKNSLEVIFLAKEIDIPLKDALDLSLRINDIFKLNELHVYLLNAEPDTRWSKKHRGLLMQQVQVMKQKLSQAILYRGDTKSSDFIKRVEEFKSANADLCDQYSQNYKQLESSDNIELSGISVLLSQIADSL
jgi:glutamate dehydrogenase